MPLTRVPGQPACHTHRSSIGTGGRVGKAEPQVIEDEEHERRVSSRWPRSTWRRRPGMVCVRLPHPSRPGPASARSGRCRRTMGAVDGAGRRAEQAGIEMVTLESDVRLLADLVLRAGDVPGWRCSWSPPSQARNLPGRPKTDKLDAMWLARLTEMGDAAALRSCRRRRSGRCGTTPGPHRPGPGPDPVLAAAGEAARRRPDQAVLAWPAS